MCVPRLFVQCNARPAAVRPVGTPGLSARVCVCCVPPQVEKEAKQIRKGIKTTYTCNPCSSLELNNGLGSRRTQRIGRTQRKAPPPPASDDRGARALVARLLLLLLAALSLSLSLSHSLSLTLPLPSAGSLASQRFD
jgi:hypothetical protein